MRAFLKAVESNPIRNVTIHISRCNLTPEAFDLFCSEANFTIINHLTLVGPLDKTKRKNFDLKKLFKVSLESLKLPCWGLDDNFMDESVDILQNNESLMLLCLDFNEFKRVDHVRSILRLNRKLMMLSLNNVVGKMGGKSDGDKIVQCVQKFWYGSEIWSFLEIFRIIFGQKIGIFKSVQLNEPPHNNVKTHRN